MSGRLRDYLLYDTVTSVCSDCLRRVEGKIIIQHDNVYMDKLCFRCNKRQKVLISDDAEYYRRCRETFIKPSEMPEKWNTPIKYGCPYDCGLCPSHEQHSCLTLIELTDHCNLDCPICYASSGTHRKDSYRTLDHILQMLDAIVANEGEPDVVQLSGGEPTLHPDFFEILDACKERPIKHLMINTNGIRIANEPEFAARLATYMPGLEVYLQFDSLNATALKRIRGADLRSIRSKALQNLEDNALSTTLVCTIQKGLNDVEIGDIIEYALQWSCVRGVTFQPIQNAGRCEDYDPAVDRLTLSEIRRRIGESSSTFIADDVLPVPCHPDSIAMAYALKLSGQIIPLTRHVDDDMMMDSPRSTIQFEHDENLKSSILDLLSTSQGPEGASSSLAQLLCCLPELVIPGEVTYENVFRIIIMDFIDAHSFDLRSVKKTCVHVVAPDLRIIPLDTYNMFYRDGLEQKVLQPIRKELEDAGIVLLPKPEGGMKLPVLND